jgi:hypothetical protein
VDDERLPITTDTNWWHATVSFPDAEITPDAARALSAALSDHRYHFLRKDSGLRLRTERPAADLLDQLTDDHIVAGLEQLDARPGHKVPEAGAATGWLNGGRGNHARRDLPHQPGRRPETREPTTARNDARPSPGTTSPLHHTMGVDMPMARPQADVIDPRTLISADVTRIGWEHLPDSVRDAVRHLTG